MNAWAPVCIENGRMCPNARTPQKGHYQCNAVEFKKDNGSIHRFHIRSYNLMEQTITNFQNGDLSLNRDTACKGSLLDSRKTKS